VTASPTLPPSFEELDHAQRRRVFLRSGLRIVLTITLMLALYAALPAASKTGFRVLAELIAGLLLFMALLGWQVRSILDADHPEIRAIEAVAMTAPTLVVVFAFIYLSLSHASPSDFTQRLDHISAMYFTVTVVATVGFGDIVAKTDPARLLVTIQMVLDIGVFVGIVRAIVWAGRIGVRRQQEAREGPRVDVTPDG
jgi:voltage-gated potassium channel